MEEEKKSKLVTEIKAHKVTQEQKLIRVILENAVLSPT